MVERIESRTKKLRTELASQKDAYSDQTERLLAEHKLVETIYEFDPIEEEEPIEPALPFDLQAHKETWNDMLRLQENGTYPGSFSRIRSPALMLHGEHDPHPGMMIYEGLKPYMPQLEYHELQKCGHSPWRERQAKGEFFSVLSDWLREHAKWDQDEI